MQYSFGEMMEATKVIYLNACKTLEWAESMIWNLRRDDAAEIILTICNLNRVIWELGPFKHPNTGN